jgi:hypothetical protein
MLTRPYARFFSAFSCVIHASPQFDFSFSSCRFGFSPQVLEAFRHGDEELLKAYPGEDLFSIDVTLKQICDLNFL